MKVKKLLWLLPLILLGMNSCNNDEETEEMEEMEEELDLLCDGNGEDTYFPLAVGNRWYYDYNGFGGTGLNRTTTITGTEEINGETYFIAESLQGTEVNPDSYEYINEYRVSENGDIVTLFDTGEEYVFIPANPTVGMEWDYPWFGPLKRRVTGLGYSFSSSHCDYTNVLVIGTYNEDGDFVSNNYYHLGIGEVTNKLEEVTLN